MGADAALAIEDSPNGVAAARAAGVAVLVTRSAYFETFDARDALANCAHLDAPVRGAGGAVAPCAEWPWLQRLHAAALHLHCG